MTLRVFLWHYLWIAPHLLLVGVAIGMWRQRVIRQFPIFFVYVIEEIVQFLVLYPMAVTPAVTAETYLRYEALGLGISTGLRFGIIHEIFAFTFRNYPSLSPLGSQFFVGERRFS